MGRPTLLTDKMRAAIIEVIRESGVSPSRAALTLGVSPKTLSDWREQFPEFPDELDQAKSQFIVDRLRKIDGGVLCSGQKDWKAQAWLLERLARKEFGEELAVTGTLTLQVPAERLAEMQERRRTALERFAARDAANAGSPESRGHLSAAAASEVGGQKSEVGGKK